MARIRSIKPEFFTSEQVADCSPTARLLFIGLWAFCDDAGRHPASYRRLKMQVLPADDVTTAQVQALMEQLITVGLVHEYQVKGELFWQVTGWHKHQRVEKPTYRYPGPEDEDPADSAPPRRGLPDSSPTESSRVESRGEEEPTHTRTATTPRVSPIGQAETPRVGQAVSAVPPGTQTRSQVTPPVVGLDKPMPPPAPTRRAPIPTTDADLQPFFAAFCRGSGLPLTWGAAQVFPTEQIARHGLPADRVRAVAAHYREKLRDGTPSLAKFAADFDRWRASLDSLERPAPKHTAEPRPGKCPSHPSQDITAGPCELCDIVNRLAKENAA